MQALELGLHPRREGLRIERDRHHGLLLVQERDHPQAAGHGLARPAGLGPGVEPRLLGEGMVLLGLQRPQERGGQAGRLDLLHHPGRGQEHVHAAPDPAREVLSAQLAQDRHFALGPRGLAQEALLDADVQADALGHGVLVQPEGEGGVQVPGRLQGRDEGRDRQGELHGGSLSRARRRGTGGLPPPAPRGIRPALPAGAACGRRPPASGRSGPPGGWPRGRPRPLPGSRPG